MYCASAKFRIESARAISSAIVDGKSDVVMAHNINGREERHVIRRMSLKFFLFNMHQYQEDRIPGGTNRVIEIWKVLG